MSKKAAERYELTHSVVGQKNGSLSFLLSKLEIEYEGTLISS